MNTFLGFVIEWELLLVATAAVALASVIRIARAPRLILRLTTRAVEGCDRKHRVRLLVHNAETALHIQGLDVHFRAPRGAALDGIEQVSAAAGPKFEAKAAICQNARGIRELHLTTTRNLLPGRSWLFEFELPVTVNSGILCTVTPHLEGSKHSRTLSAHLNATHEMAVTYVDTLPPLYSVVVMSLAAYVTAAALILLMLEDRAAEAVSRALLILAAMTPVIAAVLHRLLRPNHPYVALGYQDSKLLRVERP